MRTHIDKARAIAKIAHHGQAEKNGSPYFGHVERVANGPHAKAYMDISVGYLHDILEDTHVTAEDLLDLGISENIVASVIILTRLDGETYFEYIDRVKTDDVATRVKLNDLTDNLDASRGGLTDSLKKRYDKAFKILTT